MRHGLLKSGLLESALLISARSILLGWFALFAITYLMKRPLLLFTARVLGASWIPTSELALECVALVAAGWILGRWNRSHAVTAELIFGAMLAVWNFGFTPSINLPWLFDLIVDTFENSRYLESLITTATTHALLFGSLFAGVQLSRPKQQPLSLADHVGKTG
jgi:hypothetical protein